MSSSPGLPSPSQLFACMPSQLLDRSSTAPIQWNAVAGFASASPLLRLAGSQKVSANKLGHTVTLEIGKDSKSLAKASKRMADLETEKPRTFKIPKALLHNTPDVTGEHNVSADVEEPVVIALTEKIPASRKPRSKDIEEGKGKTRTKEKDLQDKMTNTGLDHSLGDSMTLETPAAKRPRKKKSKDEKDSQTRLKKAKVVKPGSSRNVEKAKKAKTCTAETFNTSLGTQEEDEKAREEFRDLCLEKAIPMRRGWTPCKDTVPDKARSAELTLPSDSMTFPDTPIIADMPAARFGQLLGDFGLVQNVDVPAVQPEVSHQLSGAVAVKKRKIELVNGVSAPPPAAGQKRTKSPKKKPQTITEKATAPFALSDASAEPSLLQYFSPSGTHANDQVVVHGMPVATQMEAPAKRAPKSKTANATAKKPKLPILLSPESAMENAKNQELVFGTCSQLVREGSPTLIKNLQQAMENSLTASQELEASIVPAGKFRTSNTMAVVRPRNLWAVASRDLDDSLLEAETVDLTETPMQPKIITEMASCVQVPDMAEPQSLTEGQQQSETSHTILSKKLNLNATPVLQQELQGPILAVPKTVAEATLRKRPNKRCPVKNATNTKSDPNQMPNYQGFTDAQLAKEVAAYGFKSIKKRVGMIALLEQCWGAKVTMALQEVQANLNPLQPESIPANAEAMANSSPTKKRGRPPKSATSLCAIADDPAPKKPRGRPKKDPAATPSSPKRKRKAKSPSKILSEALVTAEDDIYDSSPPTPSPPQRSSPNSPGQLRLSQAIRPCVQAEAAGVRETKALLFAQMTKAITIFPPTNDINALTFHEKMLMYEPIVLEDLTTWLNTEGLARVGEDDEVEPAIVKEWCEDNSVCCLWRENLRGGPRGRW